VPVSLPPALESAQAAHVAALTRAPLSVQTLRTYASKNRGHLAWIADAAVDGFPLDDPVAGQQEFLLIIEQRPVLDQLIEI
jgi:hypothetical protein